MGSLSNVKRHLWISVEDALLAREWGDDYSVLPLTDTKELNSHADPMARAHTIQGAEF